MAKKQNTPSLGSGITSIAGQLYNLEGPERTRRSTAGQLLQTGLDIASEYLETAEATKNAFLESYNPDLYEVELLPKEARANYTNFAQDLKNVVSENSALAGKFSANPNSPQYKEAVQNIENAKGQLEDAYKGYTQYQTIRQNLLDNVNLIMTGDPVKDAMYNSIISEEGYKNLVTTADGLMYKDPGQDGKLIPISEIKMPDLKNPELGTIAINSIFIDPSNLGTKGTSEDIARRTIRNSASQITNNPAAAKEIMFYGIDGEPDTRYADYYIVNQAAAGKEGYEGIVFTDSAGNTLTAAQVDKNNDGTISVEEKSGLTVNQDAFNTKFEELRTNTDPNFIREYTSGLNNFLLNVGLDQYNQGLAKRVTPTKTPKDINVKLNIFDNNSKVEGVNILEKPEGGYLKKDTNTNKWYEVKTPGQKIDAEGADGFEIDYWRTQVYGLDPLKTQTTSTGDITTISKENLPKLGDEEVNVDDLFGGLTEIGWSPSSNPDKIKEGDILFNYGDEEFVVKTLTDEYGQQEYGPNKTKFTFDSTGTIEDKVTVFFGDKNSKTFEFDNVGEKDAKEAKKMQEWMREQVRKAIGQVDKGVDQKAKDLINKYK